MSVIHQHRVAYLAPPIGIVVSPDDVAILHLIHASVLRLARVEEVVACEVALLDVVVQVAHLLLGECRAIHAHVVDAGALQVRVALEGGTTHPVVCGSLLGEGLAHGEHAVEECHQPSVQEESALVVVLRVHHILPVALLRGLAQVHERLVLPSAHRVLGPLHVQLVGMVAPLGLRVELHRGEGPQEVSLSLERCLAIYLVAHGDGELAQLLQLLADALAQVDVSVLIAQIHGAVGHGGAPLQGAIVVRVALVAHRCSLIAHEVVVQYQPLLGHGAHRQARQQCEKKFFHDKILC